MASRFTVNKFELTEQNIDAAEHVKHIMGYEHMTPVIMDTINTPFYNVHAPYFIQTDCDSGNSKEINTIELAETQGNFEFWQQMKDMGMIDKNRTFPMRSMVSNPSCDM